MKFNPNCVRDILLAVEKYATSKKPIVFYQHIGLTKIENAENKYLGNYSFEEFEEHIGICSSSGYFTEKAFHNVLGKYRVEGLSPSGIDLLSQIRDNTLWKKIITNADSKIESLTKMLELIRTILGV